MLNLRGDLGSRWRSPVFVVCFSLLSGLIACADDDDEAAATADSNADTPLGTGSGSTSGGSGGWEEGSGTMGGSTSGGTTGGSNACTVENPHGDCPPGQLCVGGSCQVSDQACSASNPSGLCPIGQTCLNGACVDATASCSAMNPNGTCPEGSGCVDGQCLANDLLCSASNSTGLCAEGSRCIDGDCVDHSQLCSESMPAGVCPQPLTCMHGVCSLDVPCSVDVPHGFCPPGEACLEGTCVHHGELCSEANPVGACEIGHSCFGGSCVDDDALCSAAQPMGLCLQGQSCIDGICLEDELLCSLELPTGVCAEGQVCFAGQCVGSDLVCSQDNPTGMCAGDATCQAGVCIDPSAACSAEHPTGHCPVGQSCEGGTCREDGSLAQCHDGTQNHGESAIDCGGPNCRPCPVGATCVEANDCQSRLCAGVCLPVDPSHERDEDFESGNFHDFGYEVFSNFDPGHPWEVHAGADDCHAGAYCMATSPFQSANEVVTNELTLSVREDGNISFWLRTETEDNEHFFRFYIDGEVQLELSGVTAWTRYSFPVAATGPGGTDRVFRWEYTRSEFVSPDHPPRNSVWVDDIDFPNWNSAPTVPEFRWPAGGGVIADPQPTFSWRSYDADFDPIIYEVQFDTDPTFGNPITTGETFELNYTPEQPLATPGRYFMRARSKDTSIYRWSAWSGTHSVRIDPSLAYGYSWRQEAAGDFLANTHIGTAEVGDEVHTVTTPLVFDGRGSISNGTTVFSLEFSGLPRAQTSDNARLVITGVPMNFSQSHCFTGGTVNATIQLRADGLSAGSTSASSVTSCDCKQRTLSFPVRNLAAAVNSDGHVIFEIESPHDRVKGGAWFCNAQVSATLEYSNAGNGRMISVPIHFVNFKAKNWEKVQVSTVGTPHVSVIDVEGNPLPDELVPNNSTGLPNGSTYLWNVDPEAYPTLFLSVLLDDVERLKGWAVYANDGLRWDFDPMGQAEGWQAFDSGVEPAFTHTDGVIRLASAAEGTNPRFELQLPEGQTIDADRFTELVVRLRSSNVEVQDEDEVSLFWQNNFGSFDPVRSQSSTRFLSEFQEVHFDLTKVPPPPGQAWTGRISGLRIDPVKDFVDVVGQPVDGWAEIDWIWLR